MIFEQKPLSRTIVYIDFYPLNLFILVIEKGPLLGTADVEKCNFYKELEWVMEIIILNFLTDLLNQFFKAVRHRDISDINFPYRWVFKNRFPEF